MLADLHLHLSGSYRSDALLDHLAAAEQVLWDWYESEMEAAYGSAPPTRELVERYRQGDTSARDAFDEVFVFGDDDAGNFARFQAKFNLLIAGSALAFGPNEAIEAELRHFIPRVINYQRARGVSYAEHRMLIGTDLTSEYDHAIIDPIIELFDAAGTERLVISLPREDPYLGWERVQELALGPHGHVVTGVDFCFTEEGHPPKDKAAFFADVHAFNDTHPDRALAVLYHVGESFTDKSLESAVRWVQEAAELGVHRLGHAIALGVDPDSYGPHTRQEVVAERRDQIAYDLAHADGLRARGVNVDGDALRTELADLDRHQPGDTISVVYDAARLNEVRRRQDYAMARVAATGAVIEVCPTSNRRIGDITDGAHHPVHRFLDAGLPIVVASDDPGIFGTTLEEELDWVTEATGGGESLRQELVAASWAARSEVLTGRETPTDQ